MPEGERDNAIASSRLTYRLAPSKIGAFEASSSPFRYGVGVGTAATLASLEGLLS